MRSWGHIIPPGGRPRKARGRSISYHTAMAHLTAGHDGGARVRSLPELSSDELQRYGRHLVLPDVGLEGQAPPALTFYDACATGGGVTTSGAARLPRGNSIPSVLIL